MKGDIDLKSNHSYKNNVYDDLNEPPLLEDLGIDLEIIKMRTLSVLKMSKCDEKFLNETDMTGPLLLGFIFGMCLLFAGKAHFGYIYGFGFTGTFCLYFILNLLS